jgi:hypothetical protein
MGKGSVKCRKGTKGLAAVETRERSAVLAALHRQRSVSHKTSAFGNSPGIPNNIKHAHAPFSGSWMGTLSRGSFFSMQIPVLLPLYR